MGHEVTQLVEALRYEAEVAGSIPGGVIGIFRRLNPSGVDQASTRNEYQEHFLGVRVADA